MMFALRTLRVAIVTEGSWRWLNRTRSQLSRQEVVIGCSKDLWHDIRNMPPNRAIRQCQGTCYQIDYYQQFELISVYIIIIINMNVWVISFNGRIAFQS